MHMVDQLLRVIHLREHRVACFQNKNAIAFPSKMENLIAVEKFLHL